MGKTLPQSAPSADTAELQRTYKERKMLALKQKRAAAKSLTPSPTGVGDKDSRQTI